MNTHHTLKYFSTLSLNEGCQVNFQFFPPLSSWNKTKPWNPSHPLIQTDWIHSWPRGASSHCSFLCFFCCECTFCIALHCTSSAGWPASGKWHFCLVSLYAVSLIPLSDIVRLSHSMLTASHIWWTRATNCCGCGQFGGSAGPRAVVRRVWNLFWPFRPHSWV